MLTFVYWMASIAATFLAWAFFGNMASLLTFAVFVAGAVVRKLLREVILWR